MVYKEYNPNEPISVGVYKNMPIDVYHSYREWNSWSMLKHMWDSPAHYKWELDRPKQGFSPVLDFGNAFEVVVDPTLDVIEHLAVFDRKDMPEPKKDFRTKANREYKEEFINKAKLDGKYILDIDESHSIDVATKMAENFYKHSEANMINQFYDTQISVFWICPDTGLKLRTRPDYLLNSSVADLKTTRISIPSQKLREINNQKYNFSLAMQCKGLIDTGLSSEEDLDAKWIFASKIPPYNTDVVKMSTEMIKMSIEGLMNKLLDLKRCLGDGEFLSYNKRVDNGVLEYKMPTWYSIENNIQKIGDDFR